MHYISTLPPMPPDYINKHACYNCQAREKCGILPTGNLPNDSVEWTAKICNGKCGILRKLV